MEFPTHTYIPLSDHEIQKKLAESGADTKEQLVKEKEWILFEEMCKRTINVSGNLICEICGKVGWKHKPYMNDLIDDGTGRMKPWLIIGCDGYLWKF